MKKFNNMLEGTDCGDAGLPPRRGGIAKSKPILRIVPKLPNAGSSVIQFPMRGGTPAQNQHAQRTDCRKGEVK